MDRAQRPTTAWSAQATTTVSCAGPVVTHEGHTATVRVWNAWSTTPRARSTSRGRDGVTVRRVRLEIVVVRFVSIGGTLGGTFHDREAVYDDLLHKYRPSQKAQMGPLPFRPG